MAAKKPAAKPATTAVAQRAQVQLPAEVQEQMAADIAAFQQRMSAPTGNRIAVTQDKKFRNAAGGRVVRSPATSRTSSTPCRR